MVWQVLDVIYWGVNKTFQAAGKFSLSKYCQHVGKNSNAILLTPVPQSLAEKFVETLTSSHEAQMCSKCFLKSCVVK